MSLLANLILHVILSERKKKGGEFRREKTFFCMHNVLSATDTFKV